LLPESDLVLELLVEILELCSLGQLEKDLGHFRVSPLQGLSLDAGLLHVPMSRENLRHPHSCIDASLTSSVKLNKVEVVVSKDSLHQEHIELVGSIRPDEDNIAWRSLHPCRVLLGSWSLRLP
jgi:hypothetical protein